MKVSDITGAIEEFAPLALQEAYDNAGLQVGNNSKDVSAALLCLDVTEDVLKEACRRHCGLIISHHPLIFGGVKQIIGANPVQRIIAEAIKAEVAIYSAHTNLDSAPLGVNHEIACELGLKDVAVLEPKKGTSDVGLGAIGYIQPMPALEFLRRVKETFKVKDLRYSAHSPKLTVRKVAVCGGSGASLIRTAIDAGADVIVTADIKYHDFTTFSDKILIADIGHYESELCTKKILNRIIREKFPNFVTYFSEVEKNPVNYL